jgi:inorganic pyrophosphatase
MSRVLLIGLAGDLGTLSRYFVGVFSGRALGTAFPYATLPTAALRSAEGVVMHAWHDIPLGTSIEASFPAVVETPRDCQVQCALEPITGLLRVKRILFGAVQYPANYGFVPDARADDGEPLSAHQLAEVERFFRDYRALEGVAATTGGFATADEANALIRELATRYEKRGRGVHGG